MTRWFYDDPLAAAWMIERQGIKLVTPDGEELYCKDGQIGFRATIPVSDPPTPHSGMTIFVQSCDPHYVHPDSLPLLSPREGDIVVAHGLGVFAVYDGNPTAPFGAIVSLAMARDYAGGCSVIWRDGKAFMPPQQEARVA